MAVAFVPRVRSVAGTDEDITIEYDLIYRGSGVPNGVDLSVVSITVGPSDSLTAIRVKLQDAIIADATSFGYNVPLANMILPQYQRGS